MAIGYNPRWTSEDLELEGEQEPSAGAGDVFKTLAILGNDPLSGVYLQANASEDAISNLQIAAQRSLGEVVPEGYCDLLRVSNGVQINGVYFKNAEHLVLENLDVTRPEILVLGTEGNTAEFVFDRRDRRFHTINMGHTDERFASFNSFEEMLLTVFEEQQVM